jgi:hypothetical protein
LAATFPFGPTHCPARREPRESFGAQLRDNLAGGASIGGAQGGSAQSSSGCVGGAHGWGSQGSGGCIGGTQSAQRARRCSTSRGILRIRGCPARRDSHRGIYFLPNPFPALAFTFSAPVPILGCIPSYSGLASPPALASCPSPAPPIAPLDENLESVLERAQLRECHASFRRVGCLEVDDLRDADDEGLKLAGLSCIHMRCLRRILADPTKAPPIAPPTASPGGVISSGIGTVQRCRG